MQVVILCGGKGTRFREQTEFIPKPMALIDNKPILWHIMKIYSHYGFDEFILPTGYKGDMIKEYFANYASRAYNFTVNTKTGKLKTHTPIKENWTVQLKNTGIETGTAKRIFQIKEFIKDDHFMVTYGDGVADVNINKLLEFHKKSGRMATISGYKPRHRFGIVEHKEGEVTNFNEKPMMKDLVNCGFMVFKKEALKYFDGSDIMLEQVLAKIAEDHQLSIYLHTGFWTSVDTQKDYEELNRLWVVNPSWKVWDD